MNKDTERRMKVMRRLRLPELQARFQEIVGQPSKSPNKKYLPSRIAEALEEQEPVRPMGSRIDPNMKVVPVRLHVDIIAQLDAARLRLGLRSRMDLFRRSLAGYLEACGEHEVAQLFDGDIHDDAE